MWTDSARRQYQRSGTRYASDLTDAEFALIEPMLPAWRKRYLEPFCVGDSIPEVPPENPADTATVSKEWWGAGRFASPHLLRSCAAAGSRLAGQRARP